MIISAERNVNLYPIYRAASDAMAWLPVFFLYFSEQLTLSEVLMLEAAYYIAVVVLEVPSGYMSDVIGRRKTLLLSCFALLAAYICFLGSTEFAGYAVGQILIAVCIAARSGTDTAFHYESLQALDRTDEYGDREAVAGKYGFIATAAAALAGGFLGSYNLAYPYLLSLLTAAVALYIVFTFTESGDVKDIDNNSPSGNSFFNQLQACFRYLKHPLLFWLFIYTVYMTIFVHIPYEFYQPYLRLLENQNALAGIKAPSMAGILFALTALIAAATSAYSIKWQRQLGLSRLLLVAAAVELAIIASMAIMLHPLIAMMLILRSGPMAVVTAPTNASIAPLIQNNHRATFLSLQSMAGRLGFAIVLAGFALLVTDSQSADWSSLAILLRISAAAGLIGLVLMAYTSHQCVSADNN